MHLNFLGTVNTGESGMPEEKKKARCPECGGTMGPAAYGRGLKVCESCGLQLTQFEYDKMWDAIRNRSTPDEERKKQKREYLDWYTSKKEK